ncbi:MAG: NUDIX domain-containing protein [Clostridia bacterium]|nr:NUDIX domain-containing protein [Clostridia bacterium]
MTVEDHFGAVKLPGGGMDSGEDDHRALIREVKEETGYDVIEETIVPFGEIEEKRLSLHEPMIWHQFSRLYFCEVYPGKGTCAYTDNEKEYGFRQALYTRFPPAAHCSVSPVRCRRSEANPHKRTGSHHTSCTPLCSSRAPAFHICP